jgi:pimeloyl-ACP methyl ester carboxylesterase
MVNRVGWFLTVILFALLAPRTGSAAPIEEGYFASINGMEQWITIRGRDSRNPILLFLHGGPGAAQSGTAPLFAPWEETFTIVQWDQPMSGATYAKNIGKDVGPLTVERYTRDGIAIIEHVLKKLGAQKLVLMGGSWGSQLGLIIANQRPDLIAAYVGTAQAVSGTRGLAIGRDLALEAARKRGDSAAVAALERLGRPPYATFEDFLVHMQYVNQPGPTEMAALEKVAPVLFSPPPPDATYVPRGLPPVDSVKLLMDALRPLWKEMFTFEAARLGLAWEIPMFCFQGELDINTPTALAKEYFDAIKAPAKEFAVIPGAGHATVFFADELLRLLNTHVRPRVMKTKWAR